MSRTKHSLPCIVHEGALCEDWNCYPDAGKGCHVHNDKFVHCMCGIRFKAGIVFLHKDGGRHKVHSDGTIYPPEDDNG